MSPSKFVCYLVCLLLGKPAQMDHVKQLATMLQDTGFKSADVGGSLILKCPDNGEAMKVFWYKQRLGQEPQLICSSYRYGKNGQFHDEFQNDPRFTVKYIESVNILNISQLQVSDTGTYFCARSISFLFEFGEVTVVSVKESGFKVTALVQQSRGEIIQSERFDTLSCIVETGSCTGDQSVFWFRNSEKLFYTHGSNNSRCERKPSTQTQTCVYKLPIKNLNPSHPGTYYCAVASCGHILFGNGTTMGFQGEANSPGALVYFMSGALIVTIVTIAVQIAFLYKLIKTSSCRQKECQGSVSSPLEAGAESFQEAGNLHYTALNINPSVRSNRQTSKTNSECVYSMVQK